MRASRGATAAWLRRSDRRLGCCGGCGEAAPAGEEETTAQGAQHGGGTEETTAQGAQQGGGAEQTVAIEEIGARLRRAALAASRDEGAGRVPQGWSARSDSCRSAGVSRATRSTSTCRSERRREGREIPEVMKSSDDSLATMGAHGKWPDAAAIRRLTVGPKPAAAPKQAVQAPVQPKPAAAPKQAVQAPVQPGTVQPIERDLDDDEQDSGTTAAQRLRKAAANSTNRFQILGEEHEEDCYDVGAQLDEAEDALRDRETKAAQIKQDAQRVASSLQGHSASSRTPTQTPTNSYNLSSPKCATQRCWQRPRSPHPRGRAC
jgi:hypothetical protein